MKQSTKLSLSSHFIPKTILKLHPTLPFPSRPPKSLSFKTISCLQSQTESQSPSQSESLTLISILRAIPDWADRVKERGMKQKRSLYNHEKWVHHRSSLRHIRHLLSSLSSRVILSLIPPVIAFTSVAVVIASYNSAVDMHWLPGFLPVLRASSLPYQLTAPALALLLVFRTEASYSRYEEGKKAWTKIIAGTNDFARMVISGVDNAADDFIKDALLRYIMAFPVALKEQEVIFCCSFLFINCLFFVHVMAHFIMICEVEQSFLLKNLFLEYDCSGNIDIRFITCHVIYDSDIDRDLQTLLDGDDLEIVLNSKHPPRCIIDFISQSLQLLTVEETKRNMLESEISCLHEGIGVCDQLMGIPIPLSYTRLTSRFLVLWHLTLPVILWDDCHWIVVPATFISAASLFCIEEVGVLIEEPFSMLALDELCSLVQSNIHETIRNQKVIQTLVAAKRKSHSCQHSTNGWPNS